MNIRKYVFRRIIVVFCVISFVFVLLSSSFTVFLINEKIANDTSLNKFYLLGLIFAVVLLAAEIFIYNIFKIKLLKAEKNIEYACNKISVNPTGIKEIDMLLNKIENESKCIASKLREMNNLNGNIIGVFEIDKVKKQAFTNEAVLKIANISDFKKENNSFTFSAEKFDDIVKNIKKYVYHGEENLFLVDFENKKTWVKAFLLENENYILGFFSDETKRAEKNFVYIKNKDGINFENMFSKEVFLKRAEEKIKENPNLTGCFATIELDSLKTINDNYGYKIGDMYIQAVENAMVNGTENCIFGKKSGYEFLIYFCDDAPKEDMRNKIENWINLINMEKFVAPDDREYKFKITAGYCFFPDDADNIDRLVKYSSYALYEARTMFYGSIHAFSLKAYNRAAFIENKVKRFYDIIDNNLIDYVFQPIVKLSDASVFGYEALMRARDEVLKYPKEILEIAESENMQYIIEKRTAFNCLKIVSENKELFKSKRLFYNTVYNKMLSNEDVSKAMEMYADIGYCLIPEVTENNSFGQFFFKKCGSIKDNGDKIAIDNYTGKFVDVENLFKVKPDYIKIDSTLIRDISLKRDSQTFVNKLVREAKEKRVTTIAVGIETYNELKTVIRLGVDLGQGFYISRPKKSFLESINPDVIAEIENISNSL